MEKNNEDVLAMNTHQAATAGDAPLPRNLSKLIKTIALYVSFIGLGLSSAITGPTLPYLQGQVGVTVEKIGVIFTGRSLGYLTGSIGSGWLFDRFDSHHDLMFTVGYLTMTLTLMFIPWSTSLVMLALLNVVSGLASGCVDTGANAVLLRLWGPMNPPYMQALHFSFGVGAVLAPLIAAPFLEENVVLPLHTGTPNETGPVDMSTAAATVWTQSVTTGHTLEFNTTSIGSAWSTPSLSIRHRKMFDEWIDNVQFVYVLFAGFVFAVTLAFAAFEVRRCITGARQKFVQHDTDKEQQRRTDRPFLAKMLVLVFLFYCFYVGIETSYGQFIATFAIEHVGLSENEASLLTAVFFGVFTFGRGCAVFVARRLSPTTMLIGSFAMTLFALAFLCFALSLHPAVLWVFSGIIGLSFSAIFPTGFTWVEEHLHVSGKVATVFIMGSSVGQMALPATTGYLIAQAGSIYMMYAIMGFALLDIAIFVLLCLLAKPRCRQAERYSVSGTADIAMTRLDSTNSLANTSPAPVV